MAEVAEAEPNAPAARLRPYQVYLLGLLLLATVCHYMDRGVLGVVQEPLKEELKLSDWELGLLSGPVFALFYSVAGVVVARYSARFRLSSLLALAIAIWSGMTALCGASVGFVQLALCRMGVGGAEGGCLPLTHTILAEEFEARRRGLAMSVVSAAPAVAAILTPLVGGLAAHAWGWRAAFVVMGLPGLLVALLIKLTLREPAGHATAQDPKAPAIVRPSFLADVTWLMKERAFRYLFLAGIFNGIANTGVSTFRVSFLVRSHGLNVAQAGQIWSIAGVLALAGALVGGYLADRFADARGRSYLIVSAVGAIATVLAYIVAFTQTDLRVVTAALMASSFAYALKNGPEFAAVQNISPSRMRATSAAVFMFGAAVIGGSVGPMLAGAVSDVFARRTFAPAFGGFDAACPGGHAAHGAARALAQACGQASAEGLRVALLGGSCVFVVVALLLYVSSRYMRINRD